MRILILSLLFACPAFAGGYRIQTVPAYNGTTVVQSYNGWVVWAQLPDGHIVYPAFPYCVDDDDE